MSAVSAAVAVGGGDAVVEDLGDHLGNHVHLTNCIHLRNHMHRYRHHHHSPVMAEERSLMRDLIALQRSRSLRDPSASPAATWRSPCAAAARRSSAVGRLSVASSQMDGSPSAMTNASKRSSRDGEHRRRRGEGMTGVRRSDGQDMRRELKTLLEQPEENGPRLGRPEAVAESAAKRRFRGTAKKNGDASLREISMAAPSNSATPHCPRYFAGEGEVGGSGRGGDLNAQRIVCGIPWNWSRIHHRGRTFLDMAGRSLSSCGRTDSRLRKSSAEGLPIQEEAQILRGEDGSGSGLSSRSVTDAEALPLLFEPPESHESKHDYSGELGLFGDHHLKDYYLAPEARSGCRGNLRASQNGMHRSLTQKYSPRTFKDLVGQNLVVQALMNAVARRKVGLLYVFHGPHGTGKTSCARVFARALNCQSIERSKPCGFCDSCMAYEVNKARYVKEVSQVGNLDFEGIMDVLDNVALSPVPAASKYRVFIVDDCDAMPCDSWSAALKVIDRAPQRVVFVLVCTSLDHLPHSIVARCQKFFFPKLKDADIIYTLQWVATKEGLDIEKDALKLIASRSDGSLRDAEMTLDQLSLLGRRISLPLVQELVGLISDDKLVDLLDLALSADTVNTVKTLREIMEAGVEPLALMSQLATIITDILAGSYVFTRERIRRKFFRRPTLSKEDTEKLRQALKTLSEAEKQLRLSNDKLTWLTAALLQLAPDQQYILPSSAEISISHSPMDIVNGRDASRNFTREQGGIPDNRRYSRSSGIEYLNPGIMNGFAHDSVSGCNNVKHNVRATPARMPTLSSGTTKASEGQIPVEGHKKNEKIWRAVLDKIHLRPLQQFMNQEGKLITVSFGPAPTVQLLFHSHASKSKAEKFREHILQAFESVLGSEVTIEIRCESKKDVKVGVQFPLVLPVCENGFSRMNINQGSVPTDRASKSGSESHTKRLHKDRFESAQPGHLQSNSHEVSKNEIVEVLTSPQWHQNLEQKDDIAQIEREDLGNVWDGEATSSHNQAVIGPCPERRECGEPSRRQSLVRSKVSLAHVIQQAEGCAQGTGWSRRKAISIAEKLEQENLRLEPRSRSLLCWKSTRTQGKLPHLRIRRRKSRSLLKLLPCARCLCTNSQR
ncbi:hypothetical protein QJS04_geneDACA014313 [Acorus gramineus]|uniref:AAA+ ATPase domain-containing protein n=1 Tax=Acorus gramineus TaxID=55184 RepID=A0AAV9A0X7_ACOGR|nr:hypothetical protein QJS04_geneDACA014313 [Acorus gramineus]